MNKISSGVLLFVLVFFTVFSRVFAQWEPDMRLTVNDSASTTSYNNGWCIAATGDTVHVVWRDEQDENWGDIYHKRSTDAGINWGSANRLTNDPAAQFYPSVAASGSIIHVVWHDERDGAEIFYARSTDGGTTWESNIRLTDDPQYSDHPSIAVSGSTVHVVWHDSRDGNFEIYYKRSTDDGTNWEQDTRLTDNAYGSYYPSVAVSDSCVHVVWYDNRDGNREIYYKRSTDNGTNWEPDTRLTNDPFIAHHPSISVSGPNVHVTWHDSRDANFEIYYKRSTDGGTNWEPDTRLTDDIDSQDYPSIAASGSNVHIVWHDIRDGDYEIYYKRSADFGASWEPDFRLTDSVGISDDPSVAVSGSRVHVVWMDARDLNYEIYYKRNPTGNQGIHESKISTIESQTLLHQNRPNPVSNTTMIQFSLPVTQYVVLAVYNVTGQRIKVLVDKKLHMGSHRVIWNGRDENDNNLSAGIYFYQLETPSSIQTKKLILSK